jgi:hypothetical protein
MAKHPVYMRVSRTSPRRHGMNYAPLSCPGYLDHAPAALGMHCHLIPRMHGHLIPRMHRHLIPRMHVPRWRCLGYLSADCMF